MKKNTKFLWLYTCILFSVALMLILFAGLTQQNYEKELETHETTQAGMQKSVAELSNTNMILLRENEILKKENHQLRSASGTDGEQLLALGRVKIYDDLASALREYDMGNIETARSFLKDIDKDLLTQPQLYIYNRIME